jgi:hypothetical protein
VTDEPEDAEQSLRDELDALVSRYVREVLGRPGLVTGWVLCVSRMHDLDDGDTAYGWDHTVGPQTDLVRSLGLLDVVSEDIREMVRRGINNPPDA